MHRTINVQPEMTFRTLPNGVLEITHPNGVRVIETREQRLELRADLVRQIADATRQLADFDAQEARIVAAPVELAEEVKLNG